MKKSFILLFAILSLTLMLCGCNKEAPETNKPTTEISTTASAEISTNSQKNTPADTNALPAATESTRVTNIIIEPDLSFADDIPEENRYEFTIDDYDPFDE